MSKQFYDRISKGTLLTALMLILSTAALSAGTKSEEIEKIMKEYYDALNVLKNFVINNFTGKYFFFCSQKEKEFFWASTELIDQLK